MKKNPEHDPSLVPTKHAYSGELRRGRKGEKDDELCWYCGKPEREHKKKIDAKKGKRLVVPVE